MNTDNKNFQENNILVLPQYIQDLIPIVRERFEQFHDAWNIQQIGDLLIGTVRDAWFNVDSTRKKYKQELEKIGFTPDIYEFERIDFSGECMREIQFHINILTNKRRLPDSQNELGYYEKYEWIFFGMSVICQKYRVLILRIDENNGDSKVIFDPETPEDQKIFDMIEIFMKRREYEQIETELLNIPLPIKGSLYGIPTDLSGCPTDGPFTVRHLLFGE